MPNKSENEEFKAWSLEYYDYDPKKEKSRESLLTIGNGYLGTRGSLEETKAGETNYPGTYIAGLYNRLVSKVADKDIENEDFVNCPNWLYVSFRVENGEWFNVASSEIISIKRNLNFLNGALTKEMVVRDEKGNETMVTSVRMASMANPHLVALKYKIQPLNYSWPIEFKSELDGNIINSGVARYNDLNQQHLKPVAQGINKDISWVSVRTTQSEIEIALAAKHTVYGNGVKEGLEIKHISTSGVSSSGFSTFLNKREEITIEKVVAIYTSKADDVKAPLESSLEQVLNARSFKSILAESEIEWGKIWDKIDIEIEGDPKSQMLIRLHLYHLMVTASPNNVAIDAGIPARGLHGEAYRGHIFWDELYILPLYAIFFPGVAKSILNYRVSRIEKAREYAKGYDYKGAMFPWQSGSDGREETQTIHLNPISGKWGDDYSSLQRHISIAIAYNTWYYFQVTNDSSFMEDGGAEMFLEICRFWASKSVLDKSSGKYSISKVMGPDEFHEEHESSKGGGVKDNAYTNIMVAWLFTKAIEILEKIPDDSKDKITSKIKFQADEINEWGKISKNLNIPVSKEGIIEQFEGYFYLKELDWEGYIKKYTNIYRLDRILKAEGKSPDDFKLAKQADTLMAFYNLDEEDISDILKNFAPTLPTDYLEKNYNYYINRTSHGSTLSRVVHAYLANLLCDQELGSKLYFEALESDFTDIQGGTTAEGIHAGVMGGTALMAITSFAGINLKKKCLHINPGLPKNWATLKFNFRFKNSGYFINLTHNKLKIEIKSNISDQVEIVFSNKKILLPTNKKLVLDY